MNRSTTRWYLASLGLIGLIGCQQATPPVSPANDAVTVVTESPTNASPSSMETAAQEAPKRRYGPVQLGSSSSGTSTTEATSAAGASEDVVAALQPLQVLLGKWTGNARKAAQLHEQEWIWDFQTDPAHPALTLAAEKGTYIRSGRLSYDPGSKEFSFQMTTPEGVERKLIGEFTEPVEDVAGDDKKLQRTYKLTLQEPSSAESNEQWQVAFHQLENNRYLVEIDRRRGSGPYQRVDTIHSQREGTSFALSDSDYGDKTCIISQGLGTITVSYQGKSYYVCCTGCKAAFEDDPAKWIAKWEAKQKEMKQ